MRQLRFRCPFRVGSFRNCFRLQSDGPAASVLIGDSHAAHLLPGLIRSPPPGGLDALIVNGGCPPLLGVERLFDGRPGPYGGLGATCSKLNAARLGYALKSPSRLVVLAFHGPQYSTNDRPDEGGASFKFAFDAKPMGDHDAFARALDRTVAAFIEAGKDVVLVGDTPSFDPDLFRRCALTRRPFTVFAVPQSACRMSRADAEAARSGVMSEFRRMAGQYPGRVRIFDAMDAVCSAEACPLRSEAGFLYRDHDHIAPVASEAIARALVATLR